MVGVLREAHWWSREIKPMLQNTSGKRADSGSWGDVRPLLRFAWQATGHSLSQVTNDRSKVGWGRQGREEKGAAVRQRKDGRGKGQDPGLPS